MVENYNYESLYTKSIDCFELLFDQIEDFLFILDENGMILRANNAMLNKLGYTDEEIKGISIIQIHPQDRRGEVLGILGKMIEGSTLRCQIPILNKFGEKIPVETRVFKGIWREKTVLFVISKDISGIKMVNGFSLQEVIKNEEGEPIELRFICVNKSYEEMFGEKK